MIRADALGVAGHDFGDRLRQRRAVVVGDNPAKITVGENAAHLAAGIHQNDRAAAPLDPADLVQHLADGELFRCHRQVLFQPEPRRADKP